MSTKDLRSEDIIDSRNVIDRIAELESMKEDDPEGFKDSDEENELDDLISLQNEAESSPDWKYGETLIRDCYFEDYAMQLAEDLGLTKNTDKWPYNCIDWNKAAEELQHDYFSVDFAGETYWIRS